MKTRRNMNDLRGANSRVEVEWIDSNSREEWHDEHEALTEVLSEEYLLCCTIGYVLHEDDDRIMLAMSFSAEPAGRRNVGNTITIPKVAIRDIKELRR